MEELLNKLRAARLRASAGQMDEAKQNIQDSLELLEDAVAGRPGPKPSVRAVRGYIEQARRFAKGEQAGFIVVCPEGTPLHGMAKHRVWNSGPEYAASVGNAWLLQLLIQLLY